MGVTELYYPVAVELLWKSPETTVTFSTTISFLVNNAPHHMNMKATSDNGIPAYTP